MTLIQKRLIILAIIIIVGIVLGRLAVRGFLNFLLGGTMFGGNSQDAQGDSRPGEQESSPREG